MTKIMVGNTATWTRGPVLEIAEAKTFKALCFFVTLMSRIDFLKLEILRNVGDILFKCLDWSLLILDRFEWFLFGLNEWISPVSFSRGPLVSIRREHCLTEYDQWSVIFSEISVVKSLIWKYLAMDLNFWTYCWIFIF